MQDKNYQEFPKWMYAPTGEARIFEREEDIPEGWSPFQKPVEEGVNDEVAIASTDDKTIKNKIVAEGATSTAKPSSKKKSSNSKKK